MDPILYRNSRFKIVNKIVNGQWIVKTAVENYSACLLDKTLNCYYHKWPNYLELDVDIGSSEIATIILHLALWCITAVTVDMSFLVDAQSEDELPKRLFGVVRNCQMEINSAIFVDNAMSSKKILSCKDETLLSQSLRESFTLQVSFIASGILDILLSIVISGLQLLKKEGFGVVSIKKRGVSFAVKSKRRGRRPGLFGLKGLYQI
ncbi:protein of unknown function-containing protein [Forsythia ovata]|uniref:Protein ENHANCED DISEASE RESISTANCE 2 C-terminal domain-containing protein n=1 Tax=Forsythia ovata TaxID=205694 RepID=A0ABD1PZI7_9LAMI